MAAVPPTPPTAEAAAAADAAHAAAVASASREVEAFAQRSGLFEPAAAMATGGGTHTERSSLWAVPRGKVDECVRVRAPPLFRRLCDMGVFRAE